MKDQDTKKLINDLIKIKKELQSVKRLYDLEDKITMELQRRGFTGAEKTDGTILTLKDNFKDKEGQPRNTGFRVAFVKRFEVIIKEPKEPKATKAQPGTAKKKGA